MPEFKCLKTAFTIRVTMLLHFFQRQNSYVFTFFQRQCSDVDKCILMPDFFSTPELDNFRFLSRPEFRS